MCGRYTLHTQKQKLAGAIAAELPESYEPDYNIGPGREILATAPDADSGAVIARMMHWGLRTPQNFHVNARIETADTAPRFRESWAEHRCLIPANGFYEWYADGVRKQPYYFYPGEDRLLFFAGLCFPAQSERFPASCVILTTEANRSVREIHQRMPVILPEVARTAWLDRQLSKSEATDLAAEVRLDAHTVSQRVNNVQHHDSRLIIETAPLNDDQMMLF